MQSVVKNVRKRTLFGGALMVAGIATATTAEANFNWTYSNANYITFMQVSADSYADGNQSQYAYSAPGLATVDFTGSQYIGGYSTASMSSTSVYAILDIDAGSAGTYVYGSIAYLSGKATVDSTTTISVDWDFTDPNGYGSVIVYDETNYIDVVGYFSGSGSQQFVLSSGAIYAISITLGGSGNTPFSNSASITVIPTPGTVALLGLAVVTSRTRRRRQ